MKYSGTVNGTALCPVAVTGYVLAVRSNYCITHAHDAYSRPIYMSGHRATGHAGSSK